MADTYDECEHGLPRLACEDCEIKALILKMETEIQWARSLVRDLGVALRSSPLGRHEDLMYSGTARGSIEAVKRVFAMATGGLVAEFREGKTSFEHKSDWQELIDVMARLWPDLIGEEKKELAGDANGI